MVQGWITYDNRTVLMEEMSHQHMSNIWYYINYILPQYYPQSVRDDIQTWLNKRFGGVILPYHPHPNFDFERAYLRKLGFLQPNGDIIIKGERVGFYLDFKNNLN